MAAVTASIDTNSPSGTLSKTKQPSNLATTKPTKVTEAPKITTGSTTSSSRSSSPQPQKLFYKPGVIEEQEEEEEARLRSRCDSPLLYRNIQQHHLPQHTLIISKAPSLNRVSTYNSLSHFSTRPESSR